VERKTVFEFVCPMCGEALRREDKERTEKDAISHMAAHMKRIGISIREEKLREQFVEGRIMKVDLYSLTCPICGERIEEVGRNKFIRKAEEHMRIHGRPEMVEKAREEWRKTRKRSKGMYVWKVVKQHGRFEIILMKRTGRKKYEPVKWYYESDLGEILKCPICGEPATSFSVPRKRQEDGTSVPIGIYLQHWSKKCEGGEGREHSWFFTKYDPIAEELLRKWFTKKSSSS